MKKQDLITLGLDEELAGKVEAALNENWLKNYIPKSRFDEVNSEKNKLSDLIKDRDKQLDDLKKSTDIDGLKKQIEDLQAANTKKDEEHAAALKQLRIDAALDTALTTAKAKNLKAVKALLDLEDAELAKDGTIKGLSDQIKNLVEAEDSKFLFEAPEPDKKPNVKGAKPAETTVETPDGKVDLTKMTYEELEAYLEANPNAEIPKIDPRTQAQTTPAPMTSAQAIAAAVVESLAQKAATVPQAQNTN